MKYLVIVNKHTTKNVHSLYKGKYVKSWLECFSVREGPMNKLD